MTLNEWQKFNNSCKKTLVFHFGTGAGFFSEYNNMVRMMVYCMNNRIKFSLYSSDCSFKLEKGWSDFFLPFTDEICDEIHHRINKRWIELYNRNYYKLLRSIYHAIKFRDISYMYVNNMPILVRRLIILLCGYKYKFNYVTSDLWYNTLKMKWNESVSNEIFSGTVLECFIEMDKFLWCYSNKASDYAIKLKQTFPFQKVDYCGMQIRGGDKFLETPLLSPELYFNKLQNIQPILILTDDYGIIKQIKNIYPEKNFFSYCEEDEHGYFNEEFVLLSPYIKYTKTVKLLVQVELLRKSKLFIGTHNAGPGEYLKIVMPESKYISIN